MGEFYREDLPLRLRAHVEYLAGTLGERNPLWYANLERARHYIERMFVDAGYDISHDAYEVAGRTFRNVIAEVPGTNRADELLLLGAHYDTAAGTPGADDNAIGVATLLELARLLREISPRLTL